MCHNNIMTSIINTHILYKQTSNISKYYNISFIYIQLALYCIICCNYTNMYTAPRSHLKGYYVNHSFIAHIKFTLI